MQYGNAFFVVTGSLLFFDEFVEFRIAVKDALR